MMHEVQTKADFVEFIENLAKDANDKNRAWENNTLEDFLEAMARYSEDIDQMYVNTGQKVDMEHPPWHVFADIIVGAIIYE